MTAICEKLGSRLKRHRHRLVTVESCTGGGIAAAITSIPGSSDWFDRGWVTYSNLAKQELVGVGPELIHEYGAVSEQVARAMALGGLLYSPASISLSVTGVAGPGGGTADKPVGRVCFGWACGDRCVTATRDFSGDRISIRRAAVNYALQTLIDKDDFF